MRVVVGVDPETVDRTLCVVIALPADGLLGEVGFLGRYR